MLGCLSFIHSYPDMDGEIIQVVYILFGVATIFFALNVFIYNVVGILLTNKRLIIKKAFTAKAINLEDVGILKYKDAVEVMKEIQTREQIKRKRPNVIIGVFFDVVEVKIINKDGYEYASLDSIGLLNFKRLKKLFDAECEKRENDSF